MNKIQELQFELIKSIIRNEFDGEKVVKSLLENQDLWLGVVMDRAGYTRPDARPYSPAIDLIKLRDINKGFWNVDTLFITPVIGKENELELVARTWEADEVDWIGGEEACYMLGSSSAELRMNPKQILRVWWD